MGKAYLDIMDAFQRKVDETEGTSVREAVFAEYLLNNPTICLT